MMNIDELKFWARLQEHIDKQRARWEAQDVARGHPPSEQERDHRFLWEAMTEDTAWDQFYGPPLGETAGG